MNETKIFKRLHEHWVAADDYAKEHGCELVSVCLRGSQNYELADENSDIDTVAFIVPLGDALIFDDKISKELHLDDEHCVVKDIRYLYYELLKGSPNMIETLMTDFYFDNPKYAYRMSRLRNEREHLARINPDRTVKAMAGMGFSKTGKNYHLERNCEMIERYTRSCKAYSEKRPFETYKAILVSNNLDHLRRLKESNYRDPVVEETMKDILEKSMLFEENKIYSKWLKIQIAKFFKEDYLL